MQHRIVMHIDMNAFFASVEQQANPELRGKRKAQDLIKRDVIVLLEGIIERGSPGMANNTFKIIRKMLNYAVEKDILPYSCVTGVKLPAPLNSKERVLTQEEIKLFWSNLDDVAMTDDVKAALKLILLTAQRPGEVIGMHTNDIDENWWTIVWKLPKLVSEFMYENSRFPTAGASRQ